MNDERPPGLLDRVVDQLAGVMDALGFNGGRLRWKWSRRRRQFGETGMRSEILWRSAQGRHKMCPSCRALVPRASQTCSDCGTELSTVRGPGIGRLISNLLPGTGAATSLLLLVNGVLFLILLLGQLRAGTGSGGLGLFSQFSFDDLARLGSGLSPMTTGYGEWWRLITPIFLHGGILHFFFNSYILLQLGPIVEEEYGTERFWVIYLLCGISGSAMSQLLRPVNTVGASGAILGLMGLLLVFGWRTGGARGQGLKQGMLRYAMYIVILSLLWRGVDHLNHAGGFICGALLGLIVPTGQMRSKQETSFWQLTSLGGVLLVLWAFYQVSAHGTDYRQYFG